MVEVEVNESSRSMIDVRCSYRHHQLQITIVIVMSNIIIIITLIIQLSTYLPRHQHKILFGITLINSRMTYLDTR